MFKSNLIWNFYPSIKPSKTRLMSASVKVFLDVGGVKFTQQYQHWHQVALILGLFFSDNWSQNFLDQDVLHATGYD